MGKEQVGTGTACPGALLPAQTGRQGPRNPRAWAVRRLCACWALQGEPTSSPRTAQRGYSILGDQGDHACLRGMVPLLPGGEHKVSQGDGKDVKMPPWPTGPARPGLEWDVQAQPCGTEPWPQLTSPRAVLVPSREAETHATGI